jgi:hypothetical protein
MSMFISPCLKNAISLWVYVGILTHLRVGHPKVISFFNSRIIRPAEGPSNACEIDMKLEIRFPLAGS